MTLTQRQQIEADFYNARALETSCPGDAELRIDPGVLPFPNHEHTDFLTAAFEALGNVRSSHVLELGCGSGTISVYLALQGATALGIDVSDQTLEIARRRAMVNGVNGSVEFRAVPAERLEVADGTFDRVIGNQVLHHFDLASALPNIRRMLKPGGRAVFCEPVLLVPEALRNLRDSGPVTRIFPRRVDTPTERSLSLSDIQLIARELPGARVRPFQVLTRIQNFVPLSAQWFNRLSSLDRLLLRELRVARFLCRFVVITYTRPQPSSGDEHVH